MSCRARVAVERWGALLLVALALSAFGCAGRGPVMDQPWDFTTDGLEATTDAAAALADGSTQATKELLGPLKGLVASMAPGGDGLVTDDVRVVAFMVANHERLRIDIARGGGDHLTAFANLVRVSPERQPGFSRRLQGEYAALYADHLSRFESVDRLLVAHYDPDWKRVLSASSP